LREEVQPQLKSPEKSKGFMIPKSLSNQSIKVVSNDKHQQD